MQILITGGTGRLGRRLIPLARAAGHSVRVLSRKSQTESGTDIFHLGDLTTGAGLPDAVSGIDAVIHLASDPRNAQVVDVQGTQRLVGAAHSAGVTHFIYCSIVGVDRIPYGYYQHKLEAERVIAGGGMPFTILRATQFHSFIAFLLNTASRFKVIMPIPSGFFVQSVAIEEVAARFCRIVGEKPTGTVHDFGGPEVLAIEEAAREWTRHRPHGFAAWPVPIYIPGKTAAAFRAGYNTCPDGERGTVTWREWLARDVSSRLTV